MSELLAAWSAWITDASVRVALLGAALAMAERAGLARAWPELRAGLWASVLALALLPLAVTSPLPHAVPRVSPTASAALGPLLAWIWGIGALGFGVAMLRWASHTRRRFAGQPLPLSRRAQRALAQACARLPLPARVAVRADALAPCPAVIGLWQPVIVLPVELMQRASQQTLTHVLLHELAHVRRRDPWAQALGLVALTVLWFHPVAWLAQRRLRQLRELSCDRTVAYALRGDVAPYRRTLLRLALDLPPQLALPAAAPRSELAARVVALRQPPRHARARAMTTACCCLALLATCLPARPTPRLVDLFPPAAQLQGCVSKRLLFYATLAESEPSPRSR